MMKLWREWGFTPEGWRSGHRGEYLVLLQGVLLIGFGLLPVYRPTGWMIDSPLWMYGRWSMAILLALAALVLIGKGLVDLGQNLTPLPYPKDNGQMVQTGVYNLVRHPLYSGLIFAALSWTVFQLSLSHLMAAIILFIFLDIKARREEAWLIEKYPDYAQYQQRVKKLIPTLY